MFKLVAPMLALTSCAAIGIRQGDNLDVAQLVSDHQQNAVRTFSRWEGAYVQVSGTVIDTGFDDTQVDKLVVTGNRFYSSGQTMRETIRFPFVRLQVTGTDALVKCVLEPGWSRDLNEASRGAVMRVSAHFVRIDDGQPATVRLRECRVRDVQPGAAPVSPAPAPAPESAAPVSL
jgi:hypothetical protein